MKYKQVVEWIHANFLDVTVHDSSGGEDLGQGCKVNWSYYEGQSTDGSYLTFEDAFGKKGKRILINRNASEVNKIVVLLHELGHHTEPQIDGETIHNEMMAWQGCFKWAKHLGITFTKGMLHHASTAFSSYLNHFNINSSLIEVWMSKYGMSRVVEEILTFSLNEPIHARINPTGTFRDTVNFTETVFKTEYNEGSLLLPKQSTRKVKAAKPIWGGEGWKKYH